MTKGQKVRLRNLEGTQFMMADFDSFHTIKTEGGTVKRLHGRSMKKYFGINEDNSLMEGVIVWAKIIDTISPKLGGQRAAKKKVRVLWDNGFYNTFWSGNLEVV